MGSVQAAGFGVPMERLFEDLVARLLRELDDDAVLPPQASYGFDTRHRLSLRPDLVLRRHGRTVAVADTKYKLLDEKGRLRNEDGYQLLAYCPPRPSGSGTSCTPRATCRASPTGWRGRTSAGGGGRDPHDPQDRAGPAARAHGGGRLPAPAATARHYDDAPSACCAAGCSARVTTTLSPLSLAAGPAQGRDGDAATSRARATPPATDARRPASCRRRGPGRPMSGPVEARTPCAPGRP